MFQKGEFVVSSNKGVCIVEDITTLNISGVDKKREYYILKPLYVTSSTVYVPVDTAEQSLRKVLTKQEAEEFIRKIPRIQLISITNEKLLEQEYKNCIRTNCCDQLVQIIKTIYFRKKKRLEAGRKVTALDARYFKQAEENLYGELAVALQMPKDSIEEYIIKEINPEI